MKKCWTIWWPSETYERRNDVYVVSQQPKKHVRSKEVVIGDDREELVIWPHAIDKHIHRSRDPLPLAPKHLCPRWHLEC